KRAGTSSGPGVQAARIRSCDRAGQAKGCIPVKSPGSRKLPAHLWGGRFFLQVLTVSGDGSPRGRRPRRLSVPLLHGYGRLPPGACELSARGEQIKEGASMIELV